MFWGFSVGSEGIASTVYVFWEMISHRGVVRWKMKCSYDPIRHELN